jgi:hypothetical protein
MVDQQEDGEQTHAQEGYLIVLRLSQEVVVESVSLFISCCLEGEGTQRGLNASSSAPQPEIRGLVSDQSKE